MAFEMSNLFSSSQQIGPPAPQQQQQQQQQHSIWSLQQFPTIPAPDNFAVNVPFMPGLAMLNQFPVSHNLPMISTQNLTQQGVHQSLNDSQKADTIQGFGILTWLSAKAGLITCKDKMIISFQLKDFCDQMLNDLTSVLRVGFTLSFHAALNETSEYTATIVQPIYGPDADLLFVNSSEVDLEAANPTPPNSKDAYSPALEHKAIPALLAIFQRHGLQQIQLSSLHSQMSNCGDDELFRYVGTSSLKRRQFVERRTHLFRLQNDDSILLQNPAVYQAVYQLASFLLRRGGATSIQSLFDYYMSNDLVQDIREHNGESRQDFLNLLTGHNWVFALFPNRTYVSVRRNLPTYDYCSFIKQHFPDLDMNRHQVPYGQPRGIQRTMSVQMGGPFSTTRPQSLIMQQPHQNSSSQNRQVPLWDSQPSLSQSANGGDQWSPLFSPNTWSNSPSTARSSNIGQLVGIGSMNDTLLNGANLNTILSMPPIKQTVSVGVQADGLYERGPVNTIGRSGCTCQCTCGRGGSAVIGSARGSSSRASRGSASPPNAEGGSQIERVSPTIISGFVSDRASSSVGVDFTPTEQNVSRGDSSECQQYYSPFGTADLLNGTRLNSLRIGN